MYCKNIFILIRNEISFYHGNDDDDAGKNTAGRQAYLDLDLDLELELILYCYESLHPFAYEGKHIENISLLDIFNNYDGPYM